MFIDTNVLVYNVKDNIEKSVKFANKIPEKSTISLQVVNEFSNIALKKLKLSVMFYCVLKNLKRVLLVILTYQLSLKQSN